MLGMKISVNGQHQMTVGLAEAHFLFTLIGWRRGGKDEIQIESCGTSHNETVDWEPVSLQPGDEIAVKLVEISGDEEIPEPVTRTLVHCLPLLDHLD